MSIQFNNVSVSNMLGFGSYKIHNAYIQDISPLKVDLIHGIYRSEGGSVYLLPVVKKAENMVLEETLDHSYLPLLGIEEFSKSSSSLVFGDIEKQWKDETVFSVQCLGGSGALKVGAEFLSQQMKCTNFYYSNPSWENHGLLFTSSGFKNEYTYRYLNEETKLIDFKGLCEDISNAAPNSVIILHACCHNPTGIDLTKEQWKTVAEIIKERNLIPFFDIAYQGFASGDIEDDAWAIRYFLREGIQFLCAHSCSKMFTMYNERVGNLTIILNSADNIGSIKYHLGRIIRYLYSNLPNHGARTVHKILTNPDLYKEWSVNFKVMVERMKEIRKVFRHALETLGNTRTWNHITEQTGMFIFLNLTVNQVKYLKKFHHVYMLNSGRINVTGLNNTNINYVAKAINDTLNKDI